MMLAEAYGNLHIGLAFGGAAIGIVIAMSRNPGLSGKILTFMFIGMALAEGMAILAWIVIPTK